MARSQSSKRLVKIESSEVSAFFQVEFIQAPLRSRPAMFMLDHPLLFHTLSFILIFNMDSLHRPSHQRVILHPSLLISPHNATMKEQIGAKIVNLTLGVRFTGAPTISSTDAKIGTKSSLSTSSEGFMRSFGPKGPAGCESTYRLR